MTAGNAPANEHVTGLDRERRRAVTSRVARPGVPGPLRHVVPRSTCRIGRPVRAAERQLIVDIHFVPADLVNHHHGPFRPAGVQFAFVGLGPPAVMLVVLIAHTAEWIWRKVPWHVQCLNIGNHLVALFLAGLALNARDARANVIDARGAAALVAADLIFLMGNHFLVGLVVKLARGQSFPESGISGLLAVILDFSVLSMGAITALVWRSNPVASILNVLPLYILYNSLRVPALEREVQDIRQGRRPAHFAAPGD